MPGAEDAAEDDFLGFQISAMVIATGSRPRKKTITQPPLSTKTKMVTIARANAGFVREEIEQQQDHRLPSAQSD